MKDRLLLLEKIEEAVAEYSCKAEDENFEAVINVSCNDGDVYVGVIG